MADRGRMVELSPTAADGILCSFPGLGVRSAREGSGGCFYAEDGHAAELQMAGSRLKWRSRLDMRARSLCNQHAAPQEHV